MVCGAGVIGVTTAYYLARAGHEVSVVERRDGPAEETSFANGGQISPSHADPWAAPENLKRWLAGISRKDAALVYNLRLDPPLWEWTLRFLANCTTRAQARNTERMLRVALYGAAKLYELRDELDLDYGRRGAGILHVYTDQRAFDAARRQADRVCDLGCPRLPVDRDTCLGLEPALAGAGGLVGGFHCPEDETGDAHAFTLALAARCEAMGVRFYPDVSIAALTRRDRQIIDVRTTQGPFRADAFVLALGAYSPLVAKTADLNLPVQPAKGYSVTLPVRDAARAPALGIIDDARKHVYSRLADAVRVAGMAEIGGYDTYVDRNRVRLLRDAAPALFPGGLDIEAGDGWVGLRPQTPDSVPIIGRTGLDNLYVNTGHGTLGWTMACGSARLIADMISRRTPEIDTTGLGLERFRALGNGRRLGERQSQRRGDQRRV